MTLYDLTAEYRNLLELVQDDEIDGQALTDTFEALGGEIEAKAENCAKVLKELEGETKKIKEECDRLYSRQKAIESNSKRIKAMLEDAMSLTGKEKFKTSLFSFSIQANAPSLGTVDETKVPEQFWIMQKPKLDRLALLKYVKEHGNTEYATVKQTRSLRIK